VRPAGRKHSCRRDKNHTIFMGDGVVVVKEDRSELHYCLACGSQFIRTARRKLDDLETGIAAHKS
jgi:hypothetical protein